MVRIVSFVAMCSVATAAILLLGLDPEWSIALLGIAVVVVSQWFVMRSKALDSNSVDAIYYTAAIVGAGLYYVSETPIREIAEKQTEVSTAEAELEAAGAAVEDIREQGSELIRERNATTVAASEAVAALSTPEMESLQSVESELAPRLAEVAFQSFAAKQILARAWDCELDIIPSATEQMSVLILEQRLSDLALGTDAPEASRGAVDIVAIEISALASQISHCESDISRARPLERGATSVSTYSGLAAVFQELGNFTTELSDPPDFATIDGENYEYLETLSLVRTYVDLNNSLRQANALAVVLEERIAQNSHLQDEAEATQASAETNFETKTSELANLSNQPLRNAVRAAGAFVANYWPFCLIVLLGLKLGRKPIFALPKAQR